MHYGTIEHRAHNMGDKNMTEEAYEGVKCDMCGDWCWYHTSYFEDIRCDDCASSDPEYQKEMLGVEE